MQELYRDYARTVVFAKNDEAQFARWAALNLDCHYRPFLPHDQSAAILDIGCGHGRFVRALLERGYKDVSGVDFSEDQIAYGIGQGLGEHICCADALDFLHGCERKFQCVLLLDILEHLEISYMIRLLKLLSERMQPGGKLIIQVPNGLAPLSPLLYADATHMRAYTPASLEQVLKIAGFNRFEHRALPPIMHGIKSSVRRALWSTLVQPLIAFYLLIVCGSRQGNIFTPNLLTVVEV